MADKFDLYREALVVETSTIWPGEADNIESNEKERIAEVLHADPARAGQLAYLRVHTGFCRAITVTAEDIERVGGGVGA